MKSLEEARKIIQQSIAETVQFQNFTFPKKTLGVQYVYSQYLPLIS